MWAFAVAGSAGLDLDKFVFVDIAAAGIVDCFGKTAAVAVVVDTVAAEAAVVADTVAAEAAGFDYYFGKLVAAVVAVDFAVDIADCFDTG